MTDAEKIERLNKQCNTLLKILAGLKEGTLKIEEVEIKVGNR